MGGLILGIDLCDDYSQISCYNEQIQDVEIVTINDDEAFVRIPTVICKKKGENTWLVGEEAYRSAKWSKPYHYSIPEVNTIAKPSISPSV